MDKIIFDNNIYVEFENIISVEDFSEATQKEKEYYIKYKAGSLDIHFRGNSFHFGPEDIYNVYNGILLKVLFEIVNKEKSKWTFMEKENYGLIAEPQGDNKIVLLEFHARYGEKEKITQELIVPKVEFLSELYRNIILFNKFYSGVHKCDLSYLEDDLEKARLLVEGFA